MVYDGLMDWEFACLSDMPSFTGALMREPYYHELKGKPVFHCRLIGDFPIDTIFSDWKGQIYGRMTSESVSKAGKQSPRKVRRLSLRDELGVYFEFGEDDVNLLASSLDMLEASRAAFLKNFPPLIRKDPVIDFMTDQYSGLSFEEVKVARCHIRNDDDLELLYGSKFRHWHLEHIKRLDEDLTGITLLHGPPGTGKSSYLRYLIKEMHPRRRFCFVPQGKFNAVVDPDAVHLWIKDYNKNKVCRVLILEDAEPLLLQRQGDCSQEGVSNLLNMADGILGDSFGLHLICTLNCRMDQVDKAVLRPGRLAGFWSFRPLPRLMAEKVASVHQRVLPENGEEFSLADIFCPIPMGLDYIETQSKLGFA